MLSNTIQWKYILELFEHLLHQLLIHQYLYILHQLLYNCNKLMHKKNFDTEINLLREYGNFLRLTYIYEVREFHPTLAKTVSAIHIRSQLWNQITKGRQGNALLDLRDKPLLKKIQIVFIWSSATRITAGFKMVWSFSPNVRQPLLYFQRFHFFCFNKEWNILFSNFMQITILLDIGKRDFSERSLKSVRKSTKIV